MDPYRNALGGFSKRDLMERSLAQVGGAGSKRVVDANEVLGNGWVIESAPSFTLTQDQSALVLENAIVVYAADGGGTVRYRNLVKVVSDAHRTAARGRVGSAGRRAPEGREREPLRPLAEHRAARAVARRQGRGRVQKSFRDPEGKTQKIERGQLVREGCGRVVLRNLRGWLMSVPAKPSTEAPERAPACTASYRYPA